jgi:hypothetical protein
MTLAPGQRIRNIRVERLLGAGGMSEVWGGFDEKLQRPVALKVVHARRRLDPVARARFLREAQLLSSLEHPGICKVYELEEVDGEDVLVLELVEGTPLAEVPPAGLDHGEKLAVGEAIAEALAVAHRHGIVHRDLKPQNVMRTPSGGVKVLDFDLAHRVGERPDGEATEGGGGSAPEGDCSAATPAGTLVGTVGYMSPEQANGDPLTTASDLYSLGILLHELVTGARAYAEAPTLEARLLKVSLAETLPVEGVDPELAELVEALENPEPTRRPPAEEVARRLRELRGQGGRARRARRVVRALAARLGLGRDRVAGENPVTIEAFTDLVFHRGLAARAEGRLEEARLCFQLCLDRDPVLHRARLELARCALETGDRREAGALARQVAVAAIELDREDLSSGAEEILAEVGVGRSTDG